MDVQQRIAQLVGQPHRRLHQVRVVAGEYPQLGDGLGVGVDAAQRVRHAPRRVGDHEGVAGVGLGLPGMQIRDPAHRQPRQIRHLNAHRLGHRDRQRPDRGRLINHDQQPSTSGEVSEHPPQRRLVVRERLVVQTMPIHVQRARMMRGLADIDTAEHRVLLARNSHLAALSLSRPNQAGRPRAPTPAATSRQTTTSSGQVSISGRWCPPTTATSLS
jgi:hypothetical protein